MRTPNKIVYVAYIRQEPMPSRLGNIEIVHEYSPNGTHRLTGPQGSEGKWAPYDQHCEITLDVIGPTFYGYTDFSGECVIQVKRLPRKH